MQMQGGGGVKRRRNGPCSARISGLAGTRRAGAGGRQKELIANETPIVSGARTRDASEDVDVLEEQAAEGSGNARSRQSWRRARKETNTWKSFPVNIGQTIKRADFVHK